MPFWSDFGQLRTSVLSWSQCSSRYPCHLASQCPERDLIRPRFTSHTFRMDIYSIPLWSPSGFFSFLFPQNVSLQMFHFRMFLVFRKTHSSVPLNLKVKIHTSEFLSPWEMTFRCVTPDIKFAWLRHLHICQPTNFSSQLVETQGKIP